MTRVSAAVAIVLACSLGLVDRSFASDSVSAALPARAQLLSVLSLPGYAHRYAVVYRTDRDRLAVVSTSGSQDRMLWSRALPAAPSRFTDPGPRGVFLALVPGAGSSARLFAYTLRGSAVTSAIAEHRSGSVSGDEGIALKSDGFTVRSRDASHQGSVRYRLVTRYTWSGSLYHPDSSRRVPDYPVGQYPKPNGVVRTAAGDVILIRLEVASTEQEREMGLMYRKSLDPDSGMVFVWENGLSHEAFWMHNTYIPLTVAFLAPEGRIQEMQDMAALSDTLHQPAEPYQYAIEVNEGFFARNGIKVGDTVELQLNP